MRRRSFGVVLASILVATASARASGARTAPDPCAEQSPLPVAFRFGTGEAPVGAPAIALDGGIYVGTADGYLHALRSDGSYRWSYTFAGAVVGRPALGASGAVLVPTARRVYALRPDGTLLWVFRSPIRIAGDLARDRRGRTHFASDDGRLFALSGRGALVGHVPGRSAVSAGPIALDGGAVAAGRSDGGVVLLAGGRVLKFTLGAPVKQLLGCGGAGLCAVSGASLHALGQGQTDWHVPAVRAGSQGSLLAVLATDSELELWSGVGGERRYRAPLPAPASGAPALDLDGNAYVPLQNGVLLAFSPQGKRFGCVRIAHSPLASPVFDAARARVLVTGSEGILAAIPLK